MNYGIVGVGGINHAVLLPREVGVRQATLCGKDVVLPTVEPRAELECASCRSKIGSAAVKKEEQPQ